MFKKKKYSDEDEEREDGKVVIFQDFASNVWWAQQFVANWQRHAEAKENAQARKDPLSYPRCSVTMGYLSDKTPGYVTFSVRPPNGSQSPAIANVVECNATRDQFVQNMRYRFGEMMEYFKKLQNGVATGIQNGLNSHSNGAPSSQNVQNEFWDEQTG